MASKVHVYGRVVTDARAAELEALWRTNWAALTMGQYSQLERWKRVQRGELAMDEARRFHEEFEEA